MRDGGQAWGYIVLLKNGDKATIAVLIISASSSTKEVPRGNLKLQHIDKYKLF